MPNPIDVTGQRFSYLVAIRKIGTTTYPRGHSRPLWLFRCDCGKEIHKNFSDVKRMDTKSCGCKKGGMPAVNRMPFGRSSFLALFNGYKYSAKERGIFWNLSEDTFAILTKLNCYYCGVEPKHRSMAHKSSFGHYIYNGLDRCDSSGAYSEENVVPCCWDCNKAKNDRSREEFLEWISRIVKNLNIAAQE